VHERERWQVIKALLKERSLVRIADACRATGASEASVRRDFARLAEQGLITDAAAALDMLRESGVHIIVVASGADAIAAA
jgi:DeoR family transcriptional regulator, ulaG and ulaABCDEF operon transcriptional repressor